MLKWLVVKLDLVEPSTPFSQTRMFNADCGSWDLFGKDDDLQYIHMHINSINGLGKESSHELKSSTNSRHEGYLIMHPVDWNLL